MTLDAEELSTIEAIAENGQSGRITSYEVSALVAAYRSHEALVVALRDCVSAIDAFVSQDDWPDPFAREALIRARASLNDLSKTEGAGTK